MSENNFIKSNRKSRRNLLGRLDQQRGVLLLESVHAAAGGGGIEAYPPMTLPVRRLKIRAPMAIRPGRKVSLLRE